VCKAFTILQACVYCVLLLNVEYCRDLEIWVRSYSRSLKMEPFESSGTVSY